LIISDFSPSEKEKSMIWAKFKENKIYSKLVKEIDQEIGRFSVGKKRLQRVAHITLARYKDEQVTKILNLKNLVKPKVDLQFKNFVLFESRLNYEGSGYLVKNFNLSQKY
jgi:2'-5' RNA ligase